MIRKAAQPGDLIVGVVGKQLGWPRFVVVSAVNMWWYPL